MVALDLKLCAKALHVFFNDDRLRCYLKDILSDKQVKGDKNKGYNPLFLYILSLHGYEKVDAEAMKFWNNHRSKFKQGYMKEYIATEANRDKDVYDADCLKISKIPGLIDASFDQNFGESANIFLLKRHVKLDGRLLLSTFFKAIFISNDLSSLMEPTTACTHTAPESSVPEHNASLLPVENLEVIQDDALDLGSMTSDEGSSMTNYDDNGLTNDLMGTEYGYDNYNRNGQGMGITGNFLTGTDGIFEENKNELGIENGHDCNIVETLNDELFDENGQEIRTNDNINKDDDIGSENGHEMDYDLNFAMDLAGTNNTNTSLLNGHDLLSIRNFETDLLELNNDEQFDDNRLDTNFDMTLNDGRLANGQGIGTKGIVLTGSDGFNGKNICNNDDLGNSNGHEMEIINNNGGGCSVSRVECITPVVQHDHCYCIPIISCIVKDYKPRPKSDFVCEICGTGYSGKSAMCNLDEHYLKVHSEVRCVRCDLKFKSLHEKVVHLNEKSFHRGCYNVYVCDLCGMEIISGDRTKIYLRQHMLIHQDQHTCKECNKSFKKYETLTTHINENHKIYVCTHDGQRYIGYKRLYTHQKAHYCRDISCKVFFKSVDDCVLHEEISHYVSLCDVCNLYCPKNISDLFKHKRECNGKLVETYLLHVRDELNVTFRAVSDLQQRLVQQASVHQEALFTHSILFAKDDAGNVYFHADDRYPFWDNKLICPAFGSVSLNPTNNSSNNLRNTNPIFPWWFKPFTFHTYPLGSSCMILYDCEFNIPKWAFQLFILEDWKAFQSDKGKRTNFKKNKDLPAGIQKALKVLDKDNDRGHLVAFQYACSRLDQEELQNQGNIFYQTASQNRGIWKQVESDLLKDIQQRNIPRSHITTGVSYTMDGEEIKYSNGIPVVHSYYKVCFMEDSGGIIKDIVCYALRNDNSISRTAVPRVSLFDIESIAPTHQFLNADLLERIPPDLLVKHGTSWVKSVP